MSAHGCNITSTIAKLKKAIHSQDGNKFDKIKCTAC